MFTFHLCSIRWDGPSLTASQVLRAGLGAASVRAVGKGASWQRWSEPREPTELNCDSGSREGRREQEGGCEEGPTPAKAGRPEPWGPGSKQFPGRGRIPACDLVHHSHQVVLELVRLGGNGREDVDSVLSDVRPSWRAPRAAPRCRGVEALAPWMGVALVHGWSRGLSDRAMQSLGEGGPHPDNLLRGERPSHTRGISRGPPAFSGLSRGPAAGSRACHGCFLTRHL